jgi:agmatine/peptidylarginine deiminase
MKNILLAIIVTFSINAISAQELNLPRELTPAEKTMLQNGNYKAPKLRNTLGGPESPMRAMAEWEELQAVVITWSSYRPILAEIVDAVKEECEVLIICNNISSVQNYLTDRGIDWSENVRFKVAPYNSVWVRDYGPNPVYMNDVEELFFVDWIYNRPRPLDDQVPIAVSEELDIPIFSTTTEPEDLVHTGGNFMSDGMGTGFSSELVLDENGPFNNWGVSNHSEIDIDAIMETYMGISSYPKMTNLLYDAIHHIDMHMKLLDEETLVVGYYPEGVADGPQINANIEYILNNFKTPFGNDYKIHRLEMPPDFGGQYPDFNGDYRTYTNSLIVNNTILVPTYEVRYDTTALRLWNEMMPGYNIVGINCNAIIPASGALHCITKEVGVHEPLLINMPNTLEACLEEPVDLFSFVKSNSAITSVELNYRPIGEIEYENLPMVLEDVNSGKWSIQLDPFQDEQTIEYYVSASNEVGKTINRPFTAPVGFWSFDVRNCSSSSVGSLEKIISDFKVFPNPSSSLTCVKLKSEFEYEVRVSLTNILGQEISEIYSGDLKRGENRFFVEASDLHAGFYNIIVESAKGIISKKLIIN